MPTLLRVLIVDDSDDDANLVIRKLRGGNYEPQWERVDTAEAMKNALEREEWDIILCDYKMPNFSAQAALRLAQKKNIDIPFIIVSGAIGEDTAVEAMKSGAHDYLMKDKLAKLVVAVEREIREAQNRNEKKKAEKNLRESEERYRLLVENAHESIIITQGTKIVFANRAAAENTCYSVEALTSEDFTKFIHPDDVNMVGNYHMRRLNGEQVPSVYTFKIICKDGTVKWVELNAALIQWKKKSATLNFLNDITERKLLDEERNENYKRIKETLDATVNSIAMIVEARDPYTTGHQMRVSLLARAIAKEMGLNEDHTNFIGTAAIIHDIGKISIPSEILSKPTELTALEFELIKIHPQSGYNILKDINFPWPVATVILQHHERMNGSGYPQKLTGEDILLESRILAIADVVEAISSHRPYRPKLGIQFALEEISQNRGILYDANVVDVCLKLFAEKNFSFSQ
jgi:PAS domain S-box-containing protein/putative nucleotidyltransferase with HDIG domain